MEQTFSCILIIPYGCKSALALPQVVKLTAIQDLVYNNYTVSMSSISAIKTELTILVALLIVLVSPSSVYALTPDSTDNKVVSLTNTQRQKVGLPALVFSNILFQAAAKHNQLMSTCSTVYGADACFLHQVTQQGEATLMTRINQLGYNAQAVAENIAWGYTTPESVMSGWMASSGHKANILSANYREIGCDYLNSHGIWWTCDFGKSSTPTSTPKPTPTLSPKPTSTSTPRPTSTVTPSPTPISLFSSKPYWCMYVYIASYCGN
jgi:uncharacterized protein YkwD